MNILICNVGSTSLKYQLFDFSRGERVLASGGAERVGSPAGRFYAKDHTTGEEHSEAAAFPTHREAIERMLAQLIPAVLPSLAELGCVGFKVVHARGVSGVQYLTEDVLSKMAAFNSVAPAHNPPYIAAIRQFRALLPDTPLIGAFETAFHQTMPPEASLYSIPIELSRKYDIHRYGFHGASHEYMSTWVADALGRTDLKLVSCHLGGSGSLCAVKNGRSIDTSMGISLQCGVMHNNRCGDIDPYIIFYLAEECGMTLPEIKTMLQTESGFLGMSGVSGDLRDVEAAANAGNDDALNAILHYAYTVKKYIGSYAAAMGGLDAIVFGGGIGRSSATVRALALSGLEFLGVRLDGEKNRHAVTGSDISMEDSSVRVIVLDTNEELVVARKAKTLLEAKKRLPLEGKLSAKPTDEEETESF